MPIADPVLADVLEVIDSRLRRLYTADADEYATVASEVILPSREQDSDGVEAIPETPKDRQIVVSIGSLQRNAAYDCPGNPPREGWTAEFRIRLRLMPSEEDSENIDVKLLRFVRDVRKAMSADSLGAYDANWVKMDSNAIDARWADEYERQINDGTSQSDGYVMPLLVDVRVNENSL